MRLHLVLKPIAAHTAPATSGTGERGGKPGVAVTVAGSNAC
jgi:hypothetical protein